MLVTRDSGANWQPQPSGTTADLTRIDFNPDAQRGWIVGAYGTILATHDGGSTWQSPRHPHPLPGPRRALALSLVALMLAALPYAGRFAPQDAHATPTDQPLSADQPIADLRDDRLDHKATVPALSGFLRNQDTEPRLTIAAASNPSANGPSTANTACEPCPALPASPNASTGGHQRVSVYGLELLKPLRVLLARDAPPGSEAKEATGMVERYRREFGLLTDALGGRLVIFVDDLDRCSQDVVNHLLEMSNYLVDAGPHRHHRRRPRAQPAWQPLADLGRRDRCRDRGFRCAATARRTRRGRGPLRAHRRRGAHRGPGERHRRDGDVAWRRLPQGRHAARQQALSQQGALLRPAEGARAGRRGARCQRARARGRARGAEFIAPDWLDRLADGSFQLPPPPAPGAGPVVQMRWLPARHVQQSGAIDPRLVQVFLMHARSIEVR